MNRGFKKSLWISVGVIGASVIAAAGACYYFAGVIGAQADAVVNAKTQAEQSADTVGALALLESQAPQAEQYSQAIQNLIPDQAGLITFNSWVNGIAAKYHMTATVTFQGNPTPSAGVTPGSANFTLVAEGPAGETAPFLDDLTTQEPGFLVSLSSFDFAESGQQENLTAQGVLYFR